MVTTKTDAAGRRLPKRLRLYVDLQEAEWEQLTTAAHSDGTTPAFLVRKIVRRYLATVTTEKTPG